MGYLLALAASDLNPVHDVAAAASAIGSVSASAIGSAMLDAMKSFATFVTNQIVTELNAILTALINLIVYIMRSTTPQFADTKFNPYQPTIFNPVWRVMVIVGVTFAVIIMTIGIISAVMRGESGLLGKQMLMGLVGVLLMASPIIPDVVQALFDTINVFSRYILSAGLTTTAAAAMHRNMSIGSQISAAVTGITPGIPPLLTTIVTLAACIAAIFVWFELLAREAIAYLIMALVPLALAGLFFKGTSAWLKKAVEGIIGVALAQIVIAVVLALGFSAALTSMKSDSITDGALFVVFMGLAALGLPIAMRVAPLALDAALVATDLSAMARRHAGGAMRKGASMAAGGMGGGAGGVGPGAGSPLVGSLARGGSGGRAGDGAATSGGSSGPKGPKGPTPGGLHDQMASVIESSTPTHPRTSSHPSAGATPSKPRPTPKPSGPHYLRPIDKNDPQKPTPKPPTRRPPGSGPEPKNKETQ